MQNLKSNLHDLIKDSALIEDLKKSILNLIKNVQEETLWSLAIEVGHNLNNPSLNLDHKAVINQFVTFVREHQGKLAMESVVPTTVVFGTSGWREPIGVGFSLLNVQKVIRAIVQMMKSDMFLKINGYSSFKEVQKSGIILMRDNRFMGDTLIKASKVELAFFDIKIFDAGQCPTGVGSLLVKKFKAAGSINFTPSHNPMDFQGLKFNPADGGPADTNITGHIEKIANSFMDDLSFVPEKCSISKIKSLTTLIDGKQVYSDYLKNENELFDLDKILDWISSNKNDLLIIVDYMHGSARGYIEQIFSQKFINELIQSQTIIFLNKNDDFSFHGTKPEPSAKNQFPLIEKLRQSKRKYTLAVALDPDADRIRFADAFMDIDMNRFGALALSLLIDKGINNGIASTAPSSDFALEIAKQNSLKIYEKAVGFKYFRPELLEKKVMVAFEESDGITFINHTLEKDALIGFIAALDLMATNNCNLSDKYLTLQKQYGYFYPKKSGVDVKGVTVDQWQEYKKNVVKTLKDGLYEKNQTIEFGAFKKTITSINTIDGLKLVFSDKSWVLLRPSGTEPKFRIYYEVASENKIKDIDKHLVLYAKVGEMILQKARDIVDGR